MRLRAAGTQIVNKNGDRLARVPRRLQHLQADAPEFENVAIVERRERIGRLSRGAEADRCADAIAQLQMPRDEVGVKVRQEYVLDLQPVFGSKGDVLIRVALRVNDRGGGGFLVPNHVRTVRQARQVELLEDHFAP